MKQMNNNIIDVSIRYFVFEILKVLNEYLIIVMDLVMEIDRFVNEDFCKKIIEKYEQDSRISSYKPLNISEYSDWEDINKQLSEYLSSGYTKYIKWLEAKIPIIDKFLNAELSSFRIEKHDMNYSVTPLQLNKNNCIPFCTFFIHLNHTENGENDFYYKQVSPGPGKLVMFPATWTTVHKGKECKDKYVIMGTFYLK